MKTLRCKNGREKYKKQGVSFHKWDQMEREWIRIFARCHDVFVSLYSSNNMTWVWVHFFLFFESVVWVHFKHIFWEANTSGRFEQLSWNGPFCGIPNIFVFSLRIRNSNSASYGGVICKIITKLYMRSRIPNMLIGGVWICCGNH